MPDVLRAALRVLPVLLTAAFALSSWPARAKPDDLLPALTGDVVLDALDDAFWYLRHDDHGRARRALEKATRRFDDLALDGSSLERAFASDAKKPYRGRPHERVLAEALLAALDIERGRCDLALPSLRQAAFFDARQQKTDVSDAVLVHALAVRCLTLSPTPTSAADLERARADLKLAAGPQADDVERAIVAPGAALVLDGRGPTLRVDDADPSRAVVVPSRDAMRTTAAAVPQATVARRGGAVIFLGKKSDAVLREKTGLALWSSTVQASTVQGRPFEEVLRERAQMKAQAENNGRARVQQAYAGARTTTTTTTRGAAGRLAQSAFLFASGASLQALGAATDDEADPRFVEGVFERVVVLTGP